MTDHRFEPSRPAGLAGNSDAPDPFSANSSHSIAWHYDGSKGVTQYQQKDIDAAKEVAAKADKMLGKLEIEHKPGISRAEVIAELGKKNVSEQESKSLAGLNNIGPSVQDAWQVPGHRHHLQEHSDAEFYRSAAQLVRKGGDKEWASELEGEAGRVDKKSTKELSVDRSRQADIYFNQQSITPAQVRELKNEIGRVEVARQIMPNVDKAALEIMRKFDKGNHGLSPAAVDTILKDGHLSQSERTLFKAVADYQKQIASDLREQAHHADSTAFLPETAATLNGSQLAAVLRRWAVGETRSDSQNNEQLLFNAIEGYEGQGIGIKSNDRFAREMDDKDQSQLNADSRAHDFHRVPHFPEVRQ